MTEAPHPASYRDPSGFIFTGPDGDPLRYVHRRYAPHYDHLMASGLYKVLHAAGLLVPHEELSPPTSDPDCHRILRPEAVRPWTYSYEWSFLQTRAAALATLRIARTALAHGAVLKDATAYNLQLRPGGAQWIDTLSFERHTEGQPWAAFGQFLRHFLYPLLLYRGVPETLPAILLAYPDGLPPRFAAEALRGKARLSLNHRMYVRLPAALAGREERTTQKTRTVSTASILRNLEHLEGWIGGLSLPADSDWERYYTETILSEPYLHEKTRVVSGWLAEMRPATALDLGCNTGHFSMLAAEAGAEVTALDTDPRCIDALWTAAQTSRLAVHALVADVCNPSPASGWGGAERTPLLHRVEGRSLVLALALVHHLAIGRNVPLSMIATLCASLSADHLLIEWVPKNDEKVQVLLRHRADVFSDYTEEAFVAHFSSHFHTHRIHRSEESGRVLFWFRKRQGIGNRE